MLLDFSANGPERFAVLEARVKEFEHLIDSAEGSLHVPKPLESPRRRQAIPIVSPLPPTRRRPSRMPGTPTFSKAVRFDSHFEHVRHFLQVDSPSAPIQDGPWPPTEQFEAETEFRSAVLHWKARNRTEFRHQISSTRSATKIP